MFNNGLFTRTVSTPVPVKVTVKVYRCANGDARFDGQIGYRIHSVRPCKFDGDRDGDGVNGL